MTAATPRAARRRSVHGRARLATALVVAGTLALAACSSGDDEAATTTTGSGAADPAGTIVVGEGATSNVSIDTSTDGTIVAAAWYELNDETGVERSLVATSTDGGVTFGEPVVIDEPATQDPQVAVNDDGTILVGALTYDAERLVDPDDPLSWPGWMVLFRSEDEGRTFEQVADLEDQTGERMLTLTEPPGMAASADGRTIMFAWQDRTPAEFLGAGEPVPGEDTVARPVWASVSTDGGETFSTPRAVAPSSCGCCRIEAFVAGDAPGVAYRGLQPVDPTHDERDPELVQADAAGNFAEPVEVSDDAYVLPLDGCPASGPGVASADGTTHVAWWTEVDGEAGWWYATGPDGGPFGEPVALPADPTISYSVELALDAEGTSWITGTNWDVPEHHLLVWEVPADGDPTAVEDQFVPLSTATEGFDVAGLPTGAAVAWLYEGDVKVRLVGT